MTAEDEAYAVSSLLALREVGKLPAGHKMTKVQADHLLGSLVARGWLEQSRCGLSFTSLSGTRSLHAFVS
jgi:non-structural maintenance of chromosomes element 1